MRFLLFNLAVVAALFYLFRADPSGSDLGNDLREDPLQAIRQELESLARDVADGRRNAEQVTPETVARAPQPQDVEAAPAEPKDRPAPAPDDRALASQEAAPAVAQAPPAPDDDARKTSADVEAIGSLPQVDDPAVAQRRAEVLDGVAPVDDGSARTSVQAGPPMEPGERLRKLYSLAEEMELLYVSKMTR